MFGKPEGKYQPVLTELDEIYLTFVDPSGKIKRTGEELVVETAEKSYMSAARLFDDIYRNKKSITKKEAYKKFVDENPELFTDGEFYSCVRVVFATALFAAVIAQYNLGAQLIFCENFPLRDMIFGMYPSLGVKNWCSMFHEPGHEPFLYGVNFGFKPVADNYKYRVLGAALDIKKRPNTIDDFMRWQNGKDFWSQPIRDLLDTQPCSG